MNELRPIVEESNLLDEEQKRLEDRISQVSLLEKKQLFNASMSCYQIFILMLNKCLAVGCRDCRLQ